VHDPFGPVSAITIRQAMSHSAGFRDPTWPWRPDGAEDQPWQPFEPTAWSQIVAMLPYTAIAFPPGSKFSYSNLGVVFLGEIIERLSGDPYAVYMEKNILRPLGMSRSYYDKSPYHLLPYRSHSWDLVKGKLSEDPFDFNTGITRSNGGLNAPLGDMLKYLNFLLGDPKQSPESASVLKRSSLEEMAKPLLPVPVNDDFQSRPGAHDEVASSFFVHTDGQLKLIGHAGWQNGFRSHFYLDPATHTAYIVAYNPDAQDTAAATPISPTLNASPAQNTRTFDFQLRDYLIDHIFRQ